MDFEVILQNFVSACIDIAWKLIVSAVVLVVGRFLIKCLLKLFPNGKKFGHIDDTVRIFANNFIKIALYAILAVIIVGIMGVPMASVITVLGTAGAAIALAVQGSLSNLMGGIMILVFKPIKVGEFVTVGGESGTVTEVGFFYTQLKTGDNVHISIPNGTMTTSVIKNFSREELRRVDIALGVAYGSDIEKVKATVLEVLDANEKVLKDPAPFIRATNMLDSSLEITVRVWCKASDYGELKSDLFEQSDVALTNAGIEIPYNKLDIEIKNSK